MLIILFIYRERMIFVMFKKIKERKYSIEGLNIHEMEFENQEGLLGILWIDTSDLTGMEYIYFIDNNNNVYEYESSTIHKVVEKNTFPVELGNQLNDELMNSGANFVIPVYF